MPSLIKDLAGYFLGTVPEASKARPPAHDADAARRQNGRKSLVVGDPRNR